MYREHFGLQDLPFGITPDTNFFFDHSTHQEALNTLLVAVRSGEGFIKVVGEVGTGKTLLCRKFLDELDRHDFVTAYIPNPYLQPMTLLLAIADELQLPYDADSTQHQMLKLLTRHLVDNYADRKRVVVCLDEAQAMPLETLESLRLLTNLETGRRKLLQVVLFGQPELDARLSEPSVRQLKQRITFACVLRPFVREETEFYLAHRLGVAGYRGPRLFSRAAVGRLHRAARGVPRLINILAHKAMLAAFGEGEPAAVVRHVRLAIADTEPLHRHAELGARLWRYVATLVASLLLSAGVVVWGGWV
ncbi:MAG: AAA family ATPase [Candidatus Muproteobacteria bacterium RBG_16_65_34]|uniref:AAA family ATPase n=1 Tax=Candidatus Muproteobacteria bacterium RBG_16_65_34 TaxID=1817760 RepID=A0A1F6TVK3_9PROT|nr:MAG: AAA family ATPase [Candidatus Muproteobacteria bacterium RBG_16_65_34]